MVTFAISGAGAVTFLSSPNFESPTDAGGNNVYDIIVHANDGHGHDVTKASRSRSTMSTT